jgi:CDP-paratose 2-epimerase
MTRTYFVTGGAGFIGCNYVHRLLKRGERAVIYDNMSRPGAQANIAWLEQTFGKTSVQLVVGDVTEANSLSAVARQADVIVHLAGQVAVTTSVARFNTLEAARLSDRNPVFLYASTNKVYGGMDDVRVVEEGSRWRYADLEYGCPETQPLDFHSPYGCSKGTGDQYVRDYARIYGLRSVVFRQSCIYGPRQFGVEDQGWLAWMTIAAVTGRQITIYGDGKQVRDVLYVEDLLDVYDAAVERIEAAKGQVYNIGGGTQNVLAIWAEFGPLLEKLLGREIPVARAAWRPGDQRVFYADVRKAERELAWRPKTSLEAGIRRLVEWVRGNRVLFPQAPT